MNWLHNTMRCCHLDLSLENMLIKGYKIKNGKFISHGYAELPYNFFVCLFMMIKF